VLSSAAVRRFSAFYRKALPEVYRYMLHRTGSASAAEDLTQETFTAAVAALQAGREAELTVPWLMGVARHKLVDHYRRSARVDRLDERVRGETPVADEFVQWNVEPTRDRTIAALGALPDHHRLVLVLRHLDDLPVPEIADLIGRSVHATESLLVRAREAFKRHYMETFDD
jgi:RNA polymerase sigma-70 factor, ECF subfamily